MDVLEPYLAHLKTLRGIQNVRFARPRGRAPDPGHDAELTLRTNAGTFPLLAVEFKSHLSHGIVDHLLARAGQASQPLLILAPHIGAGIATKLAEAGINYLDRFGNCHLALGNLYLHVEGRTGSPQSTAEKSLRSPAYQVLFAYLAEPALLDAPVRTVAEAAGVSRKPPSEVRQRLLDDGYLIETRTGRRWLQHRKDDALNLWLRGYEATVRPSLVWATYRTKSDPDELEKRIVTAFPTMGIPEFRWGGTTAGFHLTKHYRGPRTTVHVHSTPGDFRQKLGAVTDPRGNLVVMDAFGDLNWQPERETVHPLLVYSEMLREGEERAREAAEELFEELIRPTWGTP